MNSLLPMCLAAMLAVAAPMSTAAAGPLRVVYPRSESARDVRTAYPLAVLRLALERSGAAYELRESERDMQQARSLRELAKGGAVDVVWTVTTVEREAELRPIRIPIDRGLIGWRLLLIRRGDAARFDGADPEPALAAMQGVQGHDWPDLAVLRANGLRVASSPSYEGLFAMVARGHAQYLPRAVDEAQVELASHAELPLEIEPSLLLHYPSALYFFVHPDNRALAAALEAGLEQAVRDGSLEREFDGAYGALIASADLGRRRVLALANPNLPSATPLARRELWFEPGAAP
jgi:hypothetical protein